MDTLPPQYAAQTPRLYLEPLSVDKHLEGYHSIYSNPSQLVWSSAKPTASIADSRAAFLDRMRSDTKPWIQSYAILLRPGVGDEPDGIVKKDLQQNGERQEPQFIGLLGTNRQSPPPELCPELGYRLKSDFFGHGYATEALRAFLDLYWTLSERKNVQQIKAHVDVENVPSGRVMEKVGARKGNRVKLEIGKMGLCEMETWILDRPKTPDEETE